MLASRPIHSDTNSNENVCRLPFEPAQSLPTRTVSPCQSIWTSISRFMSAPLGRMPALRKALGVEGNSYLVGQRVCQRANTLGKAEYEKYGGIDAQRSEEHTSELPSLMRISYAVFCLKKKKKT